MTRRRASPVLPGTGMFYLIITSLLWAFSFGLVKDQLSTVDATAVATLRLGIALLVFLPFARLGRVPMASRARLALIGAVQFGAMYLFYLQSYHYLQAHEVALFTVLTPLYVVLIDAGLERAWRWHYLWAALLAAAGSTIILEIRSLDASHVKGFLLMQASNVCFAAGQLAWRRERIRLSDANVSDAQLFVLPYAGAFVASLAASAFITNWTQFHLGGVQIATLVYLGIIPAGVCFYWWNLGAEKVNAGTLAVMNNVKLPIAVLVSLLVFGEHTNLPRLLVGGAVLAVALVLAERGRRAV